MSRRILVFGNSGSGKSTLALRLAARGLSHLDLDVVAWVPREVPPRRRPVAESARDIEAFARAHDAWVIEGCYADLAEVVARYAGEVLFLNPGVEACLANALLRPWEPHKYPTREEQDRSLDFLLGWIREYPTRTDEFSLAAHRRVFDGFAGEKTELTSREAIAAFAV